MSHLQYITYVVKPMSTLIVTRRLYLIAHLQSVELPSAAEVCNLTASFELARSEAFDQRRRNLAIEWTLGLIVPLIMAGPICELSIVVIWFEAKHVLPTKIM